MSGSVHRCASGWRGLGSPATQLMRAVRLPPPGGEAKLMYRKCRRESVACESGRSERSARRVVVGLRAGCLSSGNAALASSRSRYRAGTLRVDLAASSSRPSRRGKSPRVGAQPVGVLANVSWAVVAPLVQSSSWPMALLLRVRTSRRPCVLAASRASESSVAGRCTRVVGFGSAGAAQRSLTNACS